MTDEKVLRGEKSGFIDDPNYVPICMHPEHNIPLNIEVPEGKIYQHVCPACKEIQYRESRISNLLDYIKKQSPTTYYLDSSPARSALTGEIGE